MIRARRLGLDFGFKPNSEHSKRLICRFSHGVLPVCIVHSTDAGLGLVEASSNAGSRKNMPRTGHPHARGRAAGASPVSGQHPDVLGQDRQEGCRRVLAGCKRPWRNAYEWKASPAPQERSMVRKWHPRRWRSLSYRSSGDRNSVLRFMAR
jgi:hypothetical protein